MSYVGLVPLDSLIHLLRGQLASIFGYLRVQDVPYLFLDSVQGNLILEGLKLFVRQFILPIFAQVAHGGTTLLLKSLWQPPEASGRDS